jgi:hypothetical protein
VHFLDDFLFINDPDPEFFGELVAHLGFFEKFPKRQDGFRVDFLGVELDTESMEARLPPDKHARALNSVRALLQSGRVFARTLEKLLGFLSFCTRVLPLGRPFLRNLFTFLRRLSHLHPHAVTRISAAAKQDLRWWSILLPQWSGIRLISPKPRNQIHLYTDASGAKGIGAWWSSFPVSARVPRAHRSRLIDWKEAYAVLFAFAKWSPQWRGSLVVVHCDNRIVVSALNSRSVRGPAIDIIQSLFLLLTLDDIEVQATWLSSRDNWIADALSRFEFEKIANIFPQYKDPSLRRRHSGSPMSALRARLQASFGTLSPLPPDHNTKPASTITINSPSSVDSVRSQQPSVPSRNGWLTSS